MFLYGFLFHFGVDAEVADEGVYAVIVEKVERQSLRHCEEVLAECCPAFHSAGSPLIRDALLTTELVEILDSGRMLGRGVNRFGFGAARLQSVRSFCLE